MDKESLAPILSVIIPTRGRQEQLKECLGCLDPVRQGIGAEEFEVIVTDDGFPSAGVLQEYGLSARWVDGPHQGPAANRNNGARVARGRWLVFLDDDCLPRAGWLGALKAEIAKGVATLIEGRTISIGNSAHPMEERVENPDGGLFWSCNLAVRRDVFLGSGGFDEEFLEPAFEDMELVERLRRSGAVTAFAAGAVVEHPVRRVSLRQLWRRTLMIRWLSLFHLKTREGFSDRSPGRVLIDVCIERSANFLRTQWRALRDFQINEWPREVFRLAWNTISFPITLPYVLYWEVRFRNEAKRRECARLTEPNAVPARARPSQA